MTLLFRKISAKRIQKYFNAYFFRINKSQKFLIPNFNNSLVRMSIRLPHRHIVFMLRLNRGKFHLISPFDFYRMTTKPSFVYDYGKLLASLFVYKYFWFNHLSVQTVLQPQCEWATTRFIVFKYLKS